MLITGVRPKALQAYTLGIPECHNEKCNDNLDLSQFLEGFYRG
jgi:hypothetical protein